MFFRRASLRGAACGLVLCVSFPVEAAPQPMRFYAQAQGTSACGGGAQLHIIAKNGGTTYAATRLDTATSLGSGTLTNPYDVAAITGITTAFPVVVTTSDVAYVLLHEACSGTTVTSGGLTYPADDGVTSVGSRIVFYAVYPAAANNFIAGVTGSPQVTMTTPTGSVVMPQTSVPAGTAVRPPALTPGTLYLVTATGGTIAAGSASAGAYAVLGPAESPAASCSNDVGRSFFAAFVGNGTTTNTGVALFNDGASNATVKFAPLLGGAAFADMNVGATSTAYGTAVTEGVYRITATSPISVWAGSPKGTNAIDNLGSDIGQMLSRWDGSSFRVRTRSQAQPTRVFARAGATIHVNGGDGISLPDGENVTLSTLAGTDIVVTGDQPFVVQTQGAALPMNDWGKWLRPLPTVDSDGDLVTDVIETGGIGACQSVAPDSDGDGIADFLDLDSDNDCIADASLAEGGDARTNPALPAGPHCAGSLPVCVVANGQGTCQACAANHGSGTVTACPSEDAPICSAGSCFACNGGAGTGASLACDAPAPVCAGGACKACDGDYGSSAANACQNVQAPFCAAGRCVPCDGGFGSGAARACTSAAAPVCAAGACLACNSGYGSGQSLACEVATAPVCHAGQCSACAGDFGSGATLACPTSAHPYCTGSACDKCGSNADCSGHPNGPICNTSTGGCGTACFVDGDCNVTTQWCAAGTCMTKTPNGQPVPDVPPLNGHCSDENGARGCASSVCSTTDDACGRKTGEPCKAADGGIANGECRSAVCRVDGTCGECDHDDTCGVHASGQVCRDETKTCASGCRGSGGNVCPPGYVCSSTTGASGTCHLPDAGTDGGMDGAASIDASVQDATIADSSAPETGGGDAEPDDDAGTGGGVFEGGGLSCAARVGGGESSGATGLIVLLGLALIRRRRGGAR